MNSIDEYSVDGGSGLDRVLQDVVIVKNDPIEPMPIDCPEGFSNVNGVCVQTGGVKTPCDCAGGPSRQVDTVDGSCACSPYSSPVNPVVTTIDCARGQNIINGQCVWPVTANPAPSVLPQSLAGIENQLKDFYQNNKTLSLVILAGAAFLLLKDK